LATAGRAAGDDLSTLHHRGGQPRAAAPRPSLYPILRGAYLDQ